MGGKIVQKRRSRALTKNRNPCGSALKANDKARGKIPEGSLTFSMLFHFLFDLFPFLFPLDDDSAPPQSRCRIPHENPFFTAAVCVCQTKEHSDDVHFAGGSWISTLPHCRTGMIRVVCKFYDLLGFAWYFMLKLFFFPFASLSLFIDMPFVLSITFLI